MNDAKTWAGLDRVAAPADFEGRVLREMDRRRRAVPQAGRARRFKWALSGSAAAVLAGLTVLNLFVFKSGSLSLKETASAAAGEAIQVMENISYHPESLSAASEPGTVYLLEQVSDAFNPTIRY